MNKKILHAPAKIKTVDHLKQALTGNQKLYFSDPSVIKRQSILSINMKVGDSIICTNHPKRSWFAKITKDNEGWIIEGA